MKYTIILFLLLLASSPVFAEKGSIEALIESDSGKRLSNKVVDLLDKKEYTISVIITGDLPKKKYEMGNPEVAVSVNNRKSENFSVEGSSLKSQKFNIGEVDLEQNDPLNIDFYHVDAIKNNNIFTNGQHIFDRLTFSFIEKGFKVTVEIRPRGVDEAKLPRR